MPNQPLDGTHDGHLNLLYARDAPPTAGLLSATPLSVIPSDTATKKSLLAGNDHTIRFGGRPGAAISVPLRVCDIRQNTLASDEMQREAWRPKLVSPEKSTR